jgi:hypothetical protein
MSVCFFPSDISAFSHLVRVLPPRKGRKTTAVKTDGRNRRVLTRRETACRQSRQRVTTRESGLFSEHALLGGIGGDFYAGEH